MPVFNEVATAETAVRRALDAQLPVEDVEIVIVDDGSSDGTSEILARLAASEPVRVFTHDRNLGKGAAIHTALEHATGTFAAVLDADLEYDPDDLAVLIEPLQAGEAQVVFGVRGFTSHSAYGFWYVVGNKFVTLAANVLYDAWLSDIMTCHKVMPTELFRSLALRERGFATEPEITARLLRAGVRIYEIPITYKARSREAGKKLTSLDGLRVLRTLVRCRFA